MDLSDVISLKQPSPNTVTDEGTTIDSKDAHPLNAPYAIVVTEVGISTVAKEVHWTKA